MGQSIDTSEGSSCVEVDGNIARETMLNQHEDITLTDSRSSEFQDVDYLDFIEGTCNRVN